MPIKRKGSDTNQTSGANAKANSATGQHRRKRMHQAINTMRTLMFTRTHLLEESFVRYEKPN